MADQVHVVAHFHWDREWYFTTDESKILLVNDMEEIMQMLETREDYPHFVLDGQSAVLEDYFSVKPENKERVKKLVESGKLIIGPWYTQTDEMVVGGESIVRNLLYGFKDCEKLGPVMKIGYLPDSFGQTARMPQILNGFGIKRSMFWRGTSERMGTSKTEFKWKDDEGSEVTVQLLPLGYAIGKYLPVEENALRERMSKYMPVLDHGATTDHILLPNGHDQMPVQKNIFEVMKSLKNIYPERNFFLSRYENVFEEIEKNQDLSVLTGEFLDGKYMRVHRSIYSTRADLKAYNTRIENKITCILEPLASVAASLGFDYHHGLIEEIWKEIMKNHAHDSIGCCCSDKVHREIENRFFVSEERVDRLIDFYKRKITDAQSCDIALDKITVFNLLPYERTQVFTAEAITKMKNFSLTKSDGTPVSFRVVKTEIVDAGLIDRQIVHYGNYDPFVRYTMEIEDTIPSMGYETYLIQKKDGEIEVQKSEKTEMENEYYHISIEKNGTLTVLDKASGKTYEDVLLVEEGSDDGDEYDYSGLEDDMILTNKDCEAKVSVTGDDWIQTAEIEVTMAVPKNLQSRKEKKQDASFTAGFTVTLKKHSKTIDVKFHCDNQIEDHRVRVLVPAGKKNDFSVSDNQFGMIRRPVYDTAMDVWEKEHWSERPDSIYPFLSYVTGDSKDGMSVITKSVREYEIIGEDYDTLAVTMFRGIGVLGKEELFRRPGRPSGIKMETPDSQLKKKLSFEFAITTEKEELAKLAKETITPFVFYNKMPYNAMKLNQPEIETPYTYSLLKENGGKTIMSVLKQAENGDGLIYRVYNPSEETEKVELCGKIKETELVNLKEETEEKTEEKPDEKTEIKIEIRKNQVRSLRIRY